MFYFVSKYCVRHIYVNVKSKVGEGAVIRNLVLAAAKATYKRQWENYMEQLKNVKTKVYNHLMGIEPEKMGPITFLLFSSQ